METVINVKSLIGTEVRSRLNAETIKNNIDGKTSVDFSGVEFISRSFADELYNIAKDNKDISLVGMSDFVLSMFNVVSNGRSKGRVRKNGTEEIKEFDNLDSLSIFLSTI